MSPCMSLIEEKDKQRDPDEGRFRSQGQLLFGRLPLHLHRRRLSWDWTLHGVLRRCFDVTPEHPTISSTRPDIASTHRDRLCKSVSLCRVINKEVDHLAITSNTWATSFIRNVRKFPEGYKRGTRVRRSIILSRYVSSSRCCWRSRMIKNLHWLMLELVSLSSFL